MNIAIIDDRAMNIKLLEHMLLELDASIHILGTANSVSSGIKLIQESQPDLVFLDIDMGDGYGFDVLKETTNISFALVFVTAFPNYALKSFSFDPLHYLVKPVQEEELREALNRYYQRAGKFSHKPQVLAVPSKDLDIPLRICIPEKDRLRFIPTKEILYLESSRAYVIFHMTSNQKVVSTRPLNSFEEMLTPFHFCRIHDKYLLNLRFVETYIRGRGGIAQLHNGEELPIAVRRKDTFLEMMGHG